MKHMLTRKILLLLAITVCSFSAAHAQTEPGDSCGVQPRFTASFDGIEARGMLAQEDLVKIKKIKAEEPDVSIIRFTYLIDCGEECEPEQRTVYGNSFSEDDLKLIQAMKSRNILSLECILGKNKKGELIAFKPFLYYIR